MKEADSVAPEELRRCLRDVMSLLALAGSWRHMSGQDILQRFSEALESCVEVDVQVARLHGDNQLLVRLHGDNQPARSQAVDTWFGGLFARQASAIERVDCEELGTLTAVHEPLGYYAALGHVIVASRRAGFPSPTELATIRCATELASTTLETARAMREREEALLAAREADELRLAEASTARKLAEDAASRSYLLVQASIALAQGLNANDALQRLVEVLAPARFEHATAWLRSPNTPVQCVATASRAGLAIAGEAGPPLPFKQTVQYAMEHGERVLVVDDLQGWLRDTDALDEAAFVAARGLRRCLVVPIRYATTLNAAIAVTTPADAPFDPRELDMLEILGRQTGMALENARLLSEAMRLRSAAEDATLIKDQFLARVSHDLRNPLGSIIGWAALIKSERMDATRLAHGIDVIERNAKSQVQLIEDLLDVSRITSGKLRLELASVPVIAAIEVALDAARLAANAKGIALVVEVDAEVGSVAVDADRFHQVLWNLASNAVKFTPAGGVIRVTAERVDSQLEVVFADNGRGITADFLPHVFNKFEQADASMRRTGGLGLGLTIVRHIVELHGGTVAVDSAGLGHGAKFTVRIPIQASIRPHIELADDTSEPAPKLLETVRLLVVDDEDEAREIVTAIVQSAGAKAVAAKSADDALARFEPDRFDAIVCDIGMPDKDGYAFIRELRARGNGARRIPAVALTAFARAVDRKKALLAGFTAHVAKPVEPSELVLVLAGLLGRQLPDED